MNDYNFKEKIEQFIIEHEVTKVRGELEDKLLSYGFEKASDNDNVLTLTNDYNGIFFEIEFTDCRLLIYYDYILVCDSKDYYDNDSEFEYARNIKISINIFKNKDVDRILKTIDECVDTMLHNCKFINRKIED